MASADNARIRPLPSSLGGSLADAFIRRYESSYDAANAAKVREAARLMSEVEEQLSDEEASDALKSSEQALALFKELNNSVGRADALRFVVLATKAGGDKAGAEKIAKDMLKEFGVAKDARSEATMTLALAEVVTDKTNKDPLINEEAMAFAKTAVACLRKLKDVKMEACAYVAVAKLEVIRKNPKEAMKAANKSIELAESCGDFMELAKATHILGEGNILNEEICHVKNGIKVGIQAFKKCLAIYHELDVKLMVAYQQRDTALWMMKCLYKPTEVNAMARDAYKTFMIHGKTKAAASCLEIIVQASIKYKDYEAASRDSFEGVTTFKKSGAQHAIAQAWILMSETHIAECKGQTAVDAIGNAVEIAGELGDERLELAVLKVKGRALCANGNFQDASDTFVKAQNLASSMQDKQEEAAVLACIVDVGIAEDDIEKSIQAADDRREIFRSLGMKSEESSALLTSAKCIHHSVVKAFDSAQVQRALSRTQEAEELAKKANDVKTQCVALLLNAKLNRLLDKDDDVVDAAFQVLENLKHTAQADRIQGEACTELGRTYMENGNLAQAMKMADQASTFAKKVVDPLFDAESMIAFAEIYYGVAIRHDRGTRAGRNSFHKYATKAYQTAKLAKTRCDRFKLKELLPKALCAVGETGISFDSDLALKSAIEAEKLSHQLNDEIGVATSIVLQANILYHTGQNAAAKDKAQQGLSLAEQLGAVALAAEVADILEQVSFQPESSTATVIAITGAPGPDTSAEATASGAVAVAKQGMDPEVVKETLFKVLESALAGDEEADLDTPLMDAGLDSLASVAFRNSLQQALGMTMPASLIFDYPNVRQITDYVVEASSS